MSSDGRKTKLIRVVFTREQIFEHKGEMVLEVPSDWNVEELQSLDSVELNGLPWRPLSEPGYGDEPERDVVLIEAVEECSGNAIDVDGVVTVGEG